jgi:hypothetical protein
MTDYFRIIGVGFCEEDTSLSRMLGWDKGTWAYRGDDGRLYVPEVISRGYAFGKEYGEGDTIGCGVNFDKGRAYFTLNGNLIGWLND